LDESSDLGTPATAVASQSAAAAAPQETNGPISSEEPPSDVLVMELSHSAPPALEQPQVGAGAHCVQDMPSLDTKQEELPGCSSASNLTPNSWKMPPSMKTFGLKRGLELDKVHHSFAVREHLFLFVTWKGCPTVDAVPLADLAKAYPMKVLEYFNSLKRIS